MPNTFAYVALFCWPIVVFILFRVTPRAPALIASILGGYLFLPYDVGINLPMLPTFDKTLIPALSAAIMCFLFPDGRKRRSQSESSALAFTKQVANLPNRTDFAHIERNTPSGQLSRANRKLAATKPLLERKLEKALLLLLFTTPFLTFIQNQEPYSVGPKVLPGLRLYDAFSLALSSLVAILPYLLGRKFLANPDRHVLLLQGMCVAGLLYSLPTLFEARMSPQLSRWIYGFLSQPFALTYKHGGFRPVVFLEHGLWLAIFLGMAILSAFSLWRHHRKAGRWLLAGFLLLGTLVLCRSFGALAIVLLLLPIVLFISSRTQIMLAAGVAFIILFYPLLRGADLIPVESITEFIASTVSQDRADSLAFRLKNEDMLLAHANDKPLTGWGGWGRSFVFDPISGREISVTDGMWIIIVGISGWFGYIAQFGLLTAPIFLLALSRSRYDVSFATSGLVLVLAANLIDMIPNATLTPISWLVAGALMGGSAQQRRAFVTKVIEQRKEKRGIEHNF